jgi:hypothetical protein
MITAGGWGNKIFWQGDIFSSEIPKEIENPLSQTL